MTRSDTGKLLKGYGYLFPSEAVANKPAHPRDSAKLLVYDRRTKQVWLDVFRNLGKYLPPGAVLVLNDTKVLPARLALKKSTGGTVKILYSGISNGNIRALSPKKLKRGEALFLGDGSHFEVLGERKGEYFLKPPRMPGGMRAILEKYGETPLPPYIKNVPLSEKTIREEYQTVFAKRPGSIAAPTASLHFTKNLLKKLKSSGTKIVYVTLHVGLGTFAPLSGENLKTGKLHAEHYEISARAAAELNRAKRQGERIIAVGTTALRTLESSCAGGRLKKLSGNTDLFIKGRAKLKFADGLITNFHVPYSSLLMLVSALVGRKKVLELYRLAIKNGFRLFSFGDGMFVR